MRRKYEVFIGGRPVIIGERVKARDRAPGSMVLDVDSSQDLHHTISLFKEDTHATGLHLGCYDPERAWEWFKEMYTWVVAAGGAVTSERFELLLMKRLGTWDLPKGKVEKGEKMEEAAVREVQEECGLTNVEIRVFLADTYHTYEHKGKQHLKMTKWYLMRASNKEVLVPQLEEDITELRWVGKKELAEIRKGVYPSLQAVINAWAVAVG